MRKWIEKYGEVLLVVLLLSLVISVGVTRYLEETPKILKIKESGETVALHRNINITASEEQMKTSMWSMIADLYIECYGLDVYKKKCESYGASLDVTYKEQEK